MVRWWILSGLEVGRRLVGLLLVGTSSRCLNFGYDLYGGLSSEFDLGTQRDRVTI